MKWLTPICLLLLLSGCQQPLTRADGDDGIATAGAVATGEESSGDLLLNLIDFSSRFEAHTPEDQLALCSELRASLGRDGDPLTGWYLATAISQVNGCGEPQEAIDLINQLLEQRFVSRQTAWLAYYQVRLLQRQQSQEQKLNKAQVQQRKLQDRLTRLAETRRLLENQLRDLKRIETSINQRLDEKEQGTDPGVAEPSRTPGR
ncbi:hypothetical protein [Sedimenticola thiotaurini]|uniref:Uncharacterized protein n=1 Tax=Sedimenticola thiotaurini TaxID=1543721 RepID=A0A0F7K2V9_9GAMM|nr:hypothetical protein [Sedimenticola thiotaurini]AKH21540.1 hypothetical protein AAY24_15590 [Sedimenticola thiotaurini]